MSQQRNDNDIPRRTPTSVFYKRGRRSKCYSFRKPSEELYRRDVANRKPKTKDTDK